jgi:uncharacterized protein with beta-barrel porin domain
VAQGVGPEFKPQYSKKKEREKNSSLTTRTLQGQAMFHKACRQQFREVSWHLHNDSFTLTPLTEKT